MTSNRPLSPPNDEYLVIYKMIGYEEEQAAIVRAPSLLAVPAALDRWWAEHGEPGFEIDHIHISISKIRS